MAYKPSAPTSSKDPLSKPLFDLAIHAKWDEIVEKYAEDPDAHTTKITISGDTALHLAVQDGKEDAVKKLVDLIVGKEDAVEVLGFKNERGDTPLHFAASMGNLPMCYDLAHSKPELIGLRNDKGETPLFVAASNGEKKAFLCVHSLIPDIPEGRREMTGMSYSRRRDGDTFLHCALDGDYLDLAFQIIHRYRGLGNCVNERGYSPLHLLANNPRAFRSGSRLGFIAQIIYDGTYANLLTVDPEETSNFLPIENKRPSTTYPENYLVCVDFFFFLKNVCVHFYNFFLGLFESLGRRRSTAAERATDTESQVPDRQRNRVFPPNYDVIYDFLKLISKALFIILGVGIYEGHGKEEKMREKEKHKWSVQIMEELLKEYSEYQYLYGEREPVPLPFDITDPEVWLEESSSSKVKAEMVEPLTEEKYFEGAINDKRTRLFNFEEKYLEVNRETPILLAAKNGITEMVCSIVKKFPVAINDMNQYKKNIVLLAVEHGQVEVYKLLLSLFMDNDRVFQKVDREGNSALHLAASGRHIRCLVPGAALQLHERYMWYEFVKRSKPWDFFPKYNKKRKTALEVLNESNQALIDDANKWMSNASQSCSVVAVLVATIAYTTSSTIPGGFNGGDSGGRDSGLPVLGGHAMFDVFSISGNVAFVLSVMALVLFLPVFSTYNQVSHFRTTAPAKLLVGLTLLLLSLTAIMVSFSAAESFIVVNGNLKFMKFLIFAATCLPIILVANQLPLYFRIFKTIVLNAFVSLKLFAST